MTNVVLFLRKQAGVTQQELAVRAGTSQPTIALYEKGVKSPTLATVQRLASSLGLELAVQFTPRMTREDLRSLAYHQAVAGLLRQDPASVVKRAKRTLLKMKKGQPGAKALFELWGFWLNLPAEELVSKILDPALTARDMRQVSPFAGLLPPQERARVLARFRKGYHP